MKNAINDKVQKLIDEGFNLPFVAYYSHEKGDCFKIKNPFTLFSEDIKVLCNVSDGFEKAIDLAIKNLSIWKKY